MNYQSITILGSTGSIGKQTIEVIRHLGIKVKALAAHSNIELLEKQAREFEPHIVAVYNTDSAKILRTRLADMQIKVVGGMDGLCEAAEYKGSTLVLNSVVGMVGLKPTLTAIRAGKTVALANKETLVAGGQLVMDSAKQNGVKIIPVDSEHSAIFQCLKGENSKQLKKILLTASGGPFFGKSKSFLANVTPKQALNHPNWNMGAKVTIDSATMMNKGLEMMEAGWLFNVPSSKIKVVVQRESIIHSMVQFDDNSVIAQMGVPDMRLPIQYALTYPDRVDGLTAELDLAKIHTLSFYDADENTFTCLSACREAMDRGGLFPAAVNGANEVAVKLFLDGKIPFTEIGNLVWAALEQQKNSDVMTLDNIMQADKEARNFVMANS